MTKFRSGLFFVASASAYAYAALRNKKEGTSARRDNHGYLIASKAERANRREEEEEVACLSAISEPPPVFRPCPLEFGSEWNQFAAMAIQRSA